MKTILKGSGKGVYCTIFRACKIFEEPEQSFLVSFVVVFIIMTRTFTDHYGEVRRYTNNF